MYGLYLDSDLNKYLLKFCEAIRTLRRYGQYAFVHIKESCHMFNYSNGIVLRFLKESYVLQKKY